MNIYGNQLVSAYCRPIKIHGGVCMLIKKNIFCKAIDVERFSLEASAELCALELSQQNMIIIVVYRSCLADVSIFFDKFEELLNSVSSKNRVTAAKTISRVRKDDDSKHMYNILHAQYKKLIVEAKKSACAEMINRSDNKGKSVWKIVNHERNLNNKMDSWKEISANEFNTFFSNIVNEIVASLNWITGPFEGADKNVANGGVRVALSHVQTTDACPCPKQPAVVAKLSNQPSRAKNE
nr:unnamed protein product [Callosobruchus analis]